MPAGFGSRLAADSSPNTGRVSENMTDNLSHPNSPEARDSASLIHPLTNLKTHLEKGGLVIEEGRCCFFPSVPSFIAPSKQLTSALNASTRDCSCVNLCVRI